MSKQPTNNSKRAAVETFPLKVRNWITKGALILCLSVGFSDISISQVGPTTLTLAEISFLFVFISMIFHFDTLKACVKKGRWVFVAWLAITASMLITTIFTDAEYRVLSLKFTLRFISVGVLTLALGTLFFRECYRAAALRTLAVAAFFIGVVGIAQRFFPEALDPILGALRPEKLRGTDPLSDPLWITGFIFDGNESIRRASSIFPYCNSLAYFAVLTVALLGYRLFEEKNQQWKSVEIGAVIVLMPTLYFTYSRGGIIAMAAGSVIACIVIIKSYSLYEKYRFRIAAVVTVTIVIVLAVFFVMPSRNPISVHNLTQVEKAENSDAALSPFAKMDTGGQSAGATIQARFALWRAAVKLFAERPFLGWGVDSFRHLFYRYAPDESRDLFYGRGLYQAHNLLLGFAAQQGILGIAGFLFFLIAIIFLLAPGRWKEHIKKLAALTGFFSAWMVANAYDWVWVDLYAHSILISAFVALAIVGGQRRD